MNTPSQFSINEKKLLKKSSVLNGMLMKNERVWIYNFVFNKFLETGTSDRTNIGSDDFP